MLFDSKKIRQSLQCPDCGADTHFFQSQLMSRVFLSTLVERNFFVCESCSRLSYEVVLWPKEFIGSEAAKILTDRHGYSILPLRNWPGD
jgi:predicted nucleic-acid-binding Zn-ribbon protein